MIKYIAVAVAGIAAGVVISLYVFIERGAPPETGNAARPAEDLRGEIDALIKGLRSPDPKARSIFHRNLTERTSMLFGFKPSALAEERDAAVNRWANWWAENRDKTKEQWLIDCLSVPGYGGKQLALRTLAGMPSRTSMPAITPLLASDDALLRLEAVRALGVLKAQTAAAALAELLEKDEDVMVRRAAARSLGLIGTRDAIAALERTTSQDDLLVKVEAAEALLYLSPEHALPVLHSLLTDGGQNTKLFAIMRLTLVRSPQSVPHLTGLLSARDNLSEEAHNLLKTIVGRDLGPDPAPYLDWYEKNKQQPK